MTGVPPSPSPQYCPTPVELDDLELIGMGALSPVTAFNQPGSPITLRLPNDVAGRAELAGAVELVDPEGLPLAQVTWPQGEVHPLTHPEFGPFRHLRLTPEQARTRYAGRTFVPVSAPLTSDQVSHLAQLGPVVLLALVGTGTGDLSPVALTRATLAAARHLPDAVVVTVPLASRDDAESDHALGLHVVANFAADDPVHALPDGSGRPADLADYPHEIASIIELDQPPPDQQGLVLFFTGLSGSGKSTLARAFVDRLLERGTRTVTSLDGDVVRRNLSAGLTFSKADRETNIRRIGWVAAEIARHHGVAVVSPIAPFDETRQQVRAMVDDAGGAFFLVHVATPLEECERRDRKGLYAKARAGEIPEFTGISSPYEEPADADVRVDTTGRTIEDCLEEVLAALRDQGYLDLTSSSVVEGVGFEAVPAHPQPAAGSPLRVLFVCTANICRSATAEALARRILPDSSDVVFTSAGTHGWVDSHLNEDMRPALPADLDVSAFRSRRLTTEMLEEADLVLTAEAAHRTFILDDRPGLFRKVFTLGQFAEAVRRAPEGLSRDDLLRHIGETRGSADPALDIPDPYRRGPEAVAVCVAQLEGLLDTVLPALSKTEEPVR
jgi:sulfate adenylyltransferase